jgi:hypothetical protein
MMGEEKSMAHWWNDTYRGKREYWERTCPSATLSTKSPTQSSLGLNPGLRGERPDTDRLSHGTGSIVSVTVRAIEVGW